MGNAFSCKQKKKKKTGESPKKPSQANNNNNRRKSKKKPKQIVLDKDRKIIQKDKELYQVVFDAEGFSVHDLALLGQKNSADTCVKQELKPKKMGRVNIIPDIMPFLTQNPAKSPKSNKKATLEESKEEFEITEILDYIDDLYLQLLDPDRTIMDDRRDSTSNTENASSK
ncbi:hypothetical protein L5515_000023 [Caenorhabditis briggsae]|uniref:Uncharacterized protein n=1 Tax=Caenorhabditis briggsae TaxID=6238 RepID=A0AAE9J0U1_CAEBR|nr:hypothetical protein L5515_000023 [Caenorhabditis briggsae]